MRRSLRDCLYRNVHTIAIVDRNLNDRILLIILDSRKRGSYFKMWTLFDIAKLKKETIFELHDDNGDASKWMRKIQEGATVEFTSCKCTFRNNLNLIVVDGIGV